MPRRFRYRPCDTPSRIIYTSERMVAERRCTGFFDWRKHCERKHHCDARQLYRSAIDASALRRQAEGQTGERLSTWSVTQQDHRARGTPEAKTDTARCHTECRENNDPPPAKSRFFNTTSKQNRKQRTSLHSAQLHCTRVLPCRIRCPSEHAVSSNCVGNI